MQRSELQRRLMEQFPQEYYTHLQRLPMNYMTEVSLDDIPVHIEMLQKLGECEAGYEDVCVRADALEDGNYKIVIGLKDQPFVLHTISCAFASLLASVKEAHIFSTKDGFVLDVFVISSEMDIFELQSHLQQKLSEDVRSSRMLHENVNQSSAAQNNPHSVLSAESSSSSLPTSGALQLTDFAVQNKIYESPNSTIFTASFKHARNAQLVALKVLDKAHLNNISQKTEFLNEIKISQQLSHPNIIKFIGCSAKVPNIFLVTEYLAGGSLYDILHLRVGKVSLPCSRIARDIASAMEYLHSFNFVHRDLKSQNVLFDNINNVFKVVDFGVTRKLGETMTKEAGSYRWMAPEVLKHQNYTPKVDVYSFGIVLWELVAREIPFKHLSPIQAAMAVSHEGRRPKIPQNCNPTLSNLIRICWTNDPKERPSFSQILGHLDGLARTQNENSATSTIKQRLFTLFSSFLPMNLYS